MDRRRRQAGSITPIWLFLMTTTLLLLILFVDREWVNYQVRKVRQTADFAAEAGAATAQITYHLRVEGRRGVLTDVWPCDDGTCLPNQEWVYSPWSTTCAGTLAQLSGTGWFDRCGCSDSSETVQIQCQEVKQLDPEIKFSAAAERVTMETFEANWVDRPNSRVTVTYYATDTRLSQRLSSLFVTIRITSLFGVNWWPPRNYPVTGRSTLKIPPLQLRT